MIYHTEVDHHVCQTFLIINRWNLSLEQGEGFYLIDEDYKKLKKAIVKIKLNSDKKSHYMDYKLLRISDIYDIKKILSKNIQTFMNNRNPKNCCGGPDCLIYILDNKRKAAANAAEPYYAAKLHWYTRRHFYYL